MMEIINLGWWFRAWFLKMFPSGSGGDANIENRFVDTVWSEREGCSGGVAWKHLRYHT